MARQLIPDFPAHALGELATEYADRAGQWYAAQATAEHKKSWGQYLTPVKVANFMAGVFESGSDTVRILDPGAGAGVLSCALCESLANRKNPPSRLILTAYETDKNLSLLLNETLSYLKERLCDRSVSFEFTVKTVDFVLSNAASLNDTLRLFKPETEGASFDVVISNPPYFKIPKSDPRAQAAATVVHGQPNIYGLFMAISACLLVPGGELIFITPRSFASGPYFRRFREHFFSKVTPKMIHVFGSRRDAFDRDEVLQENVILQAKRLDEDRRPAPSKTITISSTRGAQDLDSPTRRIVPLDFVLDMRTEDKVLSIPVTSEDDAIMSLIQSWNGSLRKYGLEISTGPVVPFRAVPLLSETGEPARDHVPLLWMQHVRPLSVEWPVAVRKPQFIQVSQDSMPLLVANKNYVLLRRFSAKEERRRLTAAALIGSSLNGQWIGLENHLNYIHRPNGNLDKEEAWGLAALLSSSLLDKYFRAANGNTQVSATELRAMPLPPLELIKQLGRSVMKSKGPLPNVDSIVMDLLTEFHPPAGQSVSIHG